MSDTAPPDGKQGPSAILAWVLDAYTPGGSHAAEHAIEALAEAGYKIIAREPTEAMAAKLVPEHFYQAMDVWRAMWDRAE